MTKHPYLCPLCLKNRTRFDVIYKLTQEIHKDEKNGEILYRSDEYVCQIRGDGRPDIDIRCDTCGYVGGESTFSKAARHRVSING